MAKLVSYASKIRKSVNWVELSSNTNKIPYNTLPEVEWGKLQELHILGSVEQKDDFVNSIEEGIPSEMNGCYISTDKSRMLILCALTEDIKKLVLKCSERLKVLDIRYTGILSLDLTNVPKLNRLELSYNRKLQIIHGLENLLELHVMSLNHTLIESEIDISCMPNLSSLSIRDALLVAAVFCSK